MKDLAIICSAIPIRHELLIRSLKTWRRSIDASGLDCSINIWSEGCPVDDFISFMEIEDNTHVAGQFETSGSPELGSNYWMEHAEAKVYLLLHPEIMLTTDAVRVAFDNAKPNVFCSFRIYWMPQYLTNHLEEYHLQCVEAIEYVNDLYQLGPSENPSRYLNLNVRENAWESDTCYSLDYATAHKVFPVPVFGFWGGIDPYLAGVRRHLSITTFNPPNPQYHQSHKKIEGRGPGEAVNAAANELINRFGSV